MPRLQIVDCGADPLWQDGETALSTSSVASGTETGWQVVSVKYTNSSTLIKPVYVRVLGKRASGDIYFGYDIVEGNTVEEAFDGRNRYQYK